MNMQITNKKESIEIPTLDQLRDHALYQLPSVPECPLKIGDSIQCYVYVRVGEDLEKLRVVAKIISTKWKHDNIIRGVFSFDVMFMHDGKLTKETTVDDTDVICIIEEA